MTIYENSRAMTNSDSPEWAWRVAGHEASAWRLSWLPQRLSYEQARAGMELDELLSRPDPSATEQAGRHPAGDPSTQERAEALAAVLGITVQRATTLLHQRMHDRRHSQ